MAFHSETAFLRSILSRKRSALEQVTWVLGLVAAPMLARMSVDHGALGLPFLTYWPSLLIAALILDLPFAILFTILSATSTQWAFGGGMWFHTPTAQRFTLFSIFALSSGAILATGSALQATVRHLEKLARQQEQFNAELRHRSRNLLSIIQALAAPGPRAENPLDFFREFSSRLDGLSRASDLLRIGTESEGRLPEIVERTIEPFGFASRISLSGEACVIPNESCIPLIMALHELCTNAVKHGALSQGTGWIDVSWFIAVDGSSLYMLWKESGGPPVTPPSHAGIGSRLLCPQPGLDSVELTFDPRGLWCEIMVAGARPELTR